MRAANRLASLLLGAVLLGGGLLVAADVVLGALGRDGPLGRTGWYEALSRARPADPAVRTVAAAVLLLGLVILAAELRRWSPHRLDLPQHDGWHLHRRSVERQLTDAARAVPGVRRARVRIRRRGDGWRPRVIATGDPAARSAVTLAVHRELDRLATSLPGRVEVRLAPRRGRA